MDNIDLTTAVNELKRRIEDLQGELILVAETLTHTVDRVATLERRCTTIEECTR